MKQTDKQILDDYAREMKFGPLDEKMEEIWLMVIRRIRDDEPRINNWAHLVDYMNIVDDDDTMDTYYGEDYFEKYP